MRPILPLLALLFLVFTAHAQPVINSFTPAFGTAGTTVTISGNNFNGSAAGNIVYFGPVKATVTSATSTTLTVKVPAGAAYCHISVLDVSTKLSAYSLKYFVPTTANGAGQTIASNSFKQVIAITHPIGAASWSPIATVAGDIDGDGKADIIMISRSEVAGASVNTLSVLRNTSTQGTLNSSSFAAAVEFQIGTTNYGADNLAVADFDGDGKLDIAVPNLYADYVTIFRNTAVAGAITSTSFAAGVNIITADGSKSIRVADIDGDGKPDIVAANSNAGSQNSVSVLQNNCTPGNISFAGAQTFTTGRGGSSIDLGDIDGDGMVDIVTANSTDHSISILRNTTVKGSITSSSFSTHVDFATAGFGPWAVVITDADNDGKPDIAVADGGGIFKNTSLAGSITSASLAPEATIPFPGVYLSVGDINGDGFPDILSSGSIAGGGYVNVSQNKGTGQINGASFSAPVGFIIGFSPYQPLAQDFDGDGRADIAACNAGYENQNVTLGILQNLIGAAPSPGVIQLSTTLLKLHKKDVANVTAALYNSAGALQDVQPLFKWVSDAPQIATADSTGKITAVSTGITYINISDTLKDSAVIAVYVLDDSVAIPAGAANVVFTPQSISVKVNLQQQIPAYMVTDFKGNTVNVTPVFKFDSSQYASVSGNYVLAGYRSGVYDLSAYVGNTKLNGSLPVLIYTDNTTGKADTLYKVSLNEIASEFKRYNLEARPVKLNVYQYITPAHNKDSSVAPIITYYTVPADHLTVSNGNVLGLSAAGNLVSKKPGVSYVTAWYKGVPSNIWRTYVMFDYSGSWKGIDKKGNKYSICYANQDPGIVYSFKANGAAEFYDLDWIFGDFKYWKAKSPASDEDVSSQKTDLVFADTLQTSVPTPIGQISYVILPHSGYLEPVFQVFWRGNTNQFSIVNNENTSDTIICTKGGDCGFDSLKNILTGSIESSWITASDSTFDYTPGQFYGYVTFNKNTQKFVEYETIDDYDLVFAPSYYGTWSVQNNSQLSLVYADTAYTTINGQTKISDIGTERDTYFVSYFTDSTIVIDSSHFVETWRNGAEDSGGDTDPFTMYLYKSQGSLPVRLLNFRAGLYGKGAVLQWQTANEINSRYFDVQRSTDNRAFTSVAKIAAAGNSSILQDYTYTDPDITNLSTGKVYYRLREVDKNGSGIYSKTITLSLGNITGWTATVMPNPVKDVINIYSSLNTSDAEVVLTDVTGKVLTRIKQRFTAGQQVRLPASYLAAGMYFLTIKTATESKQFKIVKQ